MSTTPLRGWSRRSRVWLGRRSTSTCASGRTALVPILDDDLEQLLTTLVFSARALLTVGGSIIVETSVASRDETGRSRLCLAVTASGYGAQPAESSSALGLMARRCSAELVVDGAPGTSVIRVYMPVMSIAA